MYDMYPENWGPASHRRDNPRSAENVRAALQSAFDRREDPAQRPDDN